MTALSGAERVVRGALGDIEEGHLTLYDYSHGGRSVEEYGTPGTGPVADLVVQSRGAWGKFLGGSLSTGEAYMHGDWSAEPLVDALGIFLRNDLPTRAKMHAGNLSLREKARLATRKGALALLQTVDAWKNHPGLLSVSARNVRRHYDLGNDFYAQMLDPSMTYSCGYAVEGSENTLEDMQRQKYDLVCRKLRLVPGDRLLDIGCGWGGMLKHAAEHYGVRGTGVTLSDEQYAWTRQSGYLPEGVEVRLQDYRTISDNERYDKIVSIGMFEHVGQKQYPVFMRTVFRLLKEGGRGLLHTIMRDESVRGAPPDPWIGKYIFPGGRLPYLSEITQEMHRAGLVIDESIGVEDLKPHYAETLRHWHDNFERNWRHIRQRDPVRFDETFARMWSYYLQVSEAAFRYGNLHVCQVPFTKAST